VQLFVAMSDDDAAALVTAVERDALRAAGRGKQDLEEDDDDGEAAAWRAVLAAARRVDRDVGCFNAIVTACERCGRWRHAVALIDHMSGADGVWDVDTDRPRRPALTPNANTFSAAISCCGKAGRWREALRLFDGMDRARVRKDAAVYYAVIAALQDAAQTRRAAEATAAKGNTDGTAGATEAEAADGSVSEIMRHVQRVYAEGLGSGFLQQWTGGTESEPSPSAAPGMAAAAAAAAPGEGSAAFKRELEEATRAGASAAASAGWAQPPPDDAPGGASPAQAPTGVPRVGGEDTRVMAGAVGVTAAGAAADEPVAVQPPRVLDLHGFPLSVAQAAVDVMLRDVLQAALAAAPDAPADAADFDIHFITGRGKHLNNSGTRGVLRTEIREYVKKAHGLDAAPAVGNAGLLIVSHATLRRWVDAQTQQQRGGV